ncbi:caspase family protein [Couchioplanes caeruleus]|uniref:HD domain-containing protein n=1 Tax=Couchioplanes caeruleus TaxID=56438 RepID=UPI0020C0B229|nr:caspase family protein [Couchioplanes caeruleus]UQU62521.1 caspase family protein [Couchioplanes caeruleus]
MTDRSALLIGVPSCDDDLFTPIPDVVGADIRRLADALGQSGYQVRHCGAGDPTGQEPTGNRIRAAVSRAVREAPPGGVLVVYFSGHGVVVDGQSWLVPQDAYSGPDGPAVESLVQVVPSDLSRCPADLVLFVVDACRNDLADALSAPWARGQLPIPGNGAFVLFNSCRPGERSLHGDDGSFFTQALAEVLDRRHSARTLREVCAEVTRELARKAARTDGLEQRPELVIALNGMTREQVEALVVCEGDPVSTAWRRAVESTALWARTDAPGDDVGRARHAVLDIVDDCATRWQGSRDHLQERTGIADPWSAQDYPVRVLAAAELCLSPDARLTAGEVAVLVAAPFLREIALSAGLRLAAGITPQDFTRTYRDGPRSDLEITHAMHEHVCRRAEGLARRGRTEPRDALAAWLVHRWLAGRSSLWTDPDMCALIERLAAAVTGRDTSENVTARELSSQLRALVRGIDGDPADRRLADDLRTQIFEPRLRSLAAVLWLAGVLAADPRRMPTVVVDHVGVGEGLHLSALHAATVKATWQRTGDTLALTAVCDHPALYAAFEGLVRRADATRRVLSGLELPDGFGSGVPAAFSAARVRAEINEGRPVFDTPLLQFRLSDDKVRELLMGRQLYGEPDLAIRELYQNALDACRYRRTRRAYLDRTGEPTTGWTGRIEIRQGADAQGREYIECTDNGVGMGKEVLLSTFANAGERFVYRPTFRAEYARWQELDPPLQMVPNSQFGVGVFSYFMLAEEITIVTRPIGEDDVVAPLGFHVRIASSGSLFQINPSTGMPGGGTRVRLYLTGEDRLSVLRTMRRLLWVAEFDVDVAEEQGPSDTWRPEELRYPTATTTPLKHGTDLWWVTGEGGLAADGVRTNQERHGLVVNLRGPRRPQFTVDRNRLRQWDRDWIRAEIEASLPALQEWPGLTLPWLWRVTDKTPAVAEQVFDRLLAQRRRVPVEGSFAHGVLAPIERVGCLPVDQLLFNGDPISFYGPSASNMWLLAWRVGIWKGVLTFVGMEHVPEATRVDGFPVVRPLDAAVLDKVYEAGRGFPNPSAYGRPSVEDLIDLAADEDEPPVVRLRRLRRYAITGLDVSAAREIPPVHCRFRDNDELLTEGTEHRSLLYAAAAWAPPGRPPRRALGSLLVRASADLHAPLGEVLRRAAALVPPDWTPPAPVGELCDQVFTFNDLELFARDLDGVQPWIGPSISPAHIVRVSAKLGRSVPEVLTLFDRYRPLGYEVTGRHLFPADLQRVEHEALSYAHDLGTPLTALHLFALAGRVQATVREVRAGLSRLESAGFVRLPADDPEPEAVPTESERVIINEDLMLYEYATTRQSLASRWTAVHEMSRAIGPRHIGGFEDRLVERRRLLRIVDPRRPPTLPEIIDLTSVLDCSVAEALNYFEVLFPGSSAASSLSAEALDSDVRCSRLEQRRALVGNWDLPHFGVHDLSWALTAADIVQGAAWARQSVATFLGWLEPFRAIGVPVPALDDDARRALDDRPADRYDVHMVHRTEGYGRVHGLRSISLLWLVQVAARYGWTVAECHRRMARLVPLGLSLEYRPDRCPDEYVSWQDLLVLTVHRDGQEPALHGTVTAEQIAAAAADVDETAEAVRLRLARFAGLLELRLEPTA